MHFYSTILILVFAVHQYMKYLSVSKMHQYNFHMFSTFLLPSCTFPDFLTWYHVSSPNRFVDSILHIRLLSFWLCPSSCIIKNVSEIWSVPIITQKDREACTVFGLTELLCHRSFSCVFYNMTQKTKCRNWINFAQYIMHYKFIAIIFFSYPHLQDFSLKTILLAQWKCWQWPSFKWNILYLWHTQQQNNKLWYYSKQWSWHNIKHDPNMSE